ncbi:hypothetical protein MRX96_050516 [Rhipicephalus microplus]
MQALDSSINDGSQSERENIFRKEFLECTNSCTIEYKSQVNRANAHSSTQNGAPSCTGEVADCNRQRSRLQPHKTKQQVIKNSEMLLIPRSDFEIVIRSQGGFDMATIVTMRLASAISCADNTPEHEAGEDMVCFN